MITGIVSLLDNHGVSDWRQAHKWWSTWVGIFWAGLSGLWVSFPVFQYFLPTKYYVILCILFPIILFLARVAKQPGLDDA